MSKEKAHALCTLVPTSRVDELSYLLWEMGILGLQELPPEDALYKPEIGTEFREPQSPEDWTKDERLIELASTRLKIFIPDSESIFAEIKSFLDQEALPLLETEEILPQKYIEEYKKRVRGVSFGDDLWVGPPWVGKTANEKTFIIDPGMAFGTGEHPTTQMIVEWLSNNVNKNFQKILDVGAGSGILSLVAKKIFPTAQIVATDLDPNCEEEIPKNFSLNQLSLENVQLLCGKKADLEVLISQNTQFDLIVSNIYGEVLAQLSPQITQLLKPGGTWVATGVLDGPARQAFEAALGNKKLALTLKKTFERRDVSPNDSHLWLCYEITK